MEEKKLLEIVSEKNFPVALGGCKNNKKTFDCCEYNITIFDEKDENPRIVESSSVL